MLPEIRPRKELVWIIGDFAGDFEWFGLIIVVAWEKDPAGSLTYVQNQDLKYENNSTPCEASKTFEVISDKLVGSQ